MPTTVQAAVAHAGEREFRVEELELRDPGPGEVVVEIDATAFCYSDWIALRGDTGLPGDAYPVVLGHSAVGTVVERGAGARHRVGRRVLITATPECGRCFWCRAGRVDQCAQLFVPPPVIGTLGDGRAVRAPGASATYAERTVIRDIQVFPVDSGLPDPWLAMFGCGVISGMGAVVNVAEVRPGASVLVVGCGQVGLWMIQAARAAGAEVIVAVERLAHRRALAARLGATHVLDPAACDVEEAVRDATGGRGADHGLDAGGSVDSVRTAFAATRLGGVVTLTSYVTRDTTVEFPLFDLALRGRDVRSSQSGRLDMRRDMRRFLPMLEHGVVDAEAMLGRIRPLSAMAETLEAARSRAEPTPVIAG
ncbi:oxidoreductase [Agromyces rhizosphaerae]|uniref:Oxidoreductase n=1 Tax=Agromyces rhizosphaerae TaxID=88374 RepID=A0A9W6CTI4_9MICO|nr:zinc-binding dehydrogenase [Agromyces rhizosphaerae]GLI26554.1 oxidoreductase [Agromyces rhizosphaerae]